MTALEAIQKEIKEGKHKQFELKETVKCRCGLKAIFWKTGYLCSSITAYPCEYSKPTNK